MAWRVGTFERDREGMQFRRHQSGNHGGIAIHELARRFFVFRLKYRDPERFFSRVFRSSRQNQLAGFDRALEPNEMSIQGRGVFLGPGGIGIKPRHQAQHINKLPGLLRFWLCRR